MATDPSSGQAATASSQPASAHPGAASTMAALFVPLFCLGVYNLTTTVPYAEATGGAASRKSGQLQINPNTAEWWELTVLPGVGAVTAKKIVAYRDTCRQEQSLPSEAPVFESATDLRRIHGIGPKKAIAMEPFLVFEQLPQGR